MTKTHKVFIQVSIIDVERDYSTLEPIPLTEEWLVKLGFKRSGLYHFKDQVYIYDEYGLIDTGYEYRFNYTQKQLLYVHELMNLYFSLTGQELIISE